MTLYLTDTRRPLKSAKRQNSGHVVASKLYPAGATTNSDSGVTDIRELYPVLEAMQAHEMPLLAHGEVTDPTVDIFDREAVFIERVLDSAGPRFSGAENRAGAYHDAGRGGLCAGCAGHGRGDDHRPSPAV
jgi:dihydroorotase